MERLGIQGAIPRINPGTLEKESVPYHLFKAETPGSKVTRYILHTPGLARFPKAYNPGEGAYAGAYGGAYAGTSGSKAPRGGAYGGAYGGA